MIHKTICETIRNNNVLVFDFLNWNLNDLQQ